jgi:hypothetical protein
MLSGEGGIEPPTRSLELTILPLNYSPYWQNAARAFWKGKKDTKIDYCLVSRGSKERITIGFLSPCLALDMLERASSV